MFSMTEENYQKCINSWEEQRNFTYIAIDALGSHSVVNKILAEMSEITAEMPDLSG